MSKLSDRPLCAVPWITAFSTPGGTAWRNCCSAHPQINSRQSELFEDWWYGERLQQFRDQLHGSKLPRACYNCEISEKINGHSFRTAINSTVNFADLKINWPQRWNISAGNNCNLACWTCSEHSSDVIERHKKNVGILPLSWQNSNGMAWHEIERNVLQSYDFHDTVELTLLGGEPLFDQKLIKFLEFLKSQDLADRTRLEFHTNGTVCDKKIQQILSKNSWQYLCIFISLDSTGRKAEWLRYGCIWSKIEKNLSLLESLSDYIEAHCTLSILNILDLPDLQRFCVRKQLPLKISLLKEPEYMSITNWDGDTQPFLDKIDDFGEYREYLTLVGSTPSRGTKQKLADYIRTLEIIRRPLKDYNEVLHSILF